MPTAFIPANTAACVIVDYANVFESSRRRSHCTERHHETRVDLRQKFAELIQAYNTGASTIEQYFLQLLELSRTLTDEEARHVREQLSEEELVVFDLLTRPGPDFLLQNAPK